MNRAIRVDLGLSCVITLGLLASACGSALDIDENGEGRPEPLGAAQDALRIAGDPPKSPTVPWTSRPTVFVQVAHAANATDFREEQDAIKAIDGDYFPSLLGSAKKSGSAPLYVGAWHKDRSTTGWIWDKDIAEPDFHERWQERSDQGYEFFDFDVHVDGSTPHYDGIWIKRANQRVWASNRNQSLTQLSDLVASRKADGYRPKRIKEYKVGSTEKYMGLWVNDGLTDFRWAAEHTADSILVLNTGYVAQGYRITSLSAYNDGGSVKYSAIWLKNPEVLGYAYDSNMTEAAFSAKYAANLAKNLILVDLDLFYDTSGNARYAAVWHRTEPRDTLQSNTALPAADTATLQAAIDSYETNPSAGASARFGLFVQNLTTGSWIGYNMNEPFYLASSTKFLIGAKVVDATQVGWDPTELRSIDYRGEVNRGFTLSDFDGATKPLDTFLGNMLNNSDSASTDRLWGLVDTQQQGSLKSYLRDTLGLQNVGEITTICEVDKRVAFAQDSCVFGVSCDTFEAWHRGGDGNYNATSSEKSCLGKLNNDPGDDEYGQYYATLANSITPVEYGRAMRILTGSRFTPAERERFFRITDTTDDNGFAPDMGTLYDALSTKAGGKFKVTSQVGVMFDFAGPTGDHSQITPKFSFGVYAEKFAQESFDPTPDMRNAVQAAVRFLQNR